MEIPILNKKVSKIHNLKISCPPILLPIILFLPKYKYTEIMIL